MNAVNWSDQIAALAGPFDGNRKSWLSRAARRAGIPYRMAKTLFYQSDANPKFDTAVAVLNAARKARIDAAKLEARELADKFSQIAGAMNVVDPEFHSAEIAALLNAARILRSVDAAPGGQSVTKGE